MTHQDDKRASLTLFDEAGGDVLEGFLLAKSRNLNLPPNWIKRSEQSRVSRQEAVVEALKAGDWSGIEILRDWNEAYRKAVFYKGVRILLELDRNGRSDL